LILFSTNRLLSTYFLYFSVPFTHRACSLLNGALLKQL